jgi:hypothetical protein
VSPTGQRRGRGREAPAPGQASLQDMAEEELDAPAPCLYRTGSARGLAGRLAEFDAWVAEHGSFDCLRRSHGWHAWYCATAPAARCLPAVLACVQGRDPRADPGRCDCDGTPAWRGACRGCDWEGPERPGEDLAAEDAHDHAWPGWRSLPVVPRPPAVQDRATAAGRAAITRWAAAASAVYPAGWLEAGGPVRTMRDSPRERRPVPDRTPADGWDMVAPWPASGEDPEDGQPAPDLPPGLAGPDGELTPLGIVAEAAANYLAMRGWLDPDAGEWPDGLLAELAGIAQGNPCGDTCFTTPDGYLNPSVVADHFTQRRQEEWERSLPVWTCACGQDFKMLADQGLGPSESFYEAAADGLLGDHAGGVRRNAKGRVTHSGACPGCGRRFADALARQDDPQQQQQQQTLFG